MDDREMALNQLLDIKNEIIAIHSKADECRYLQKKVEELKEEKFNAQPPKPSLKPENTAEVLKGKYKQQNVSRLENSQTPYLIAKIFNALLIVLTCVAFAFDAFGRHGIAVKTESLSSVADLSGQKIAVNFLVHAFVAIIFVVIPFVFEYILDLLEDISFIGIIIILVFVATIGVFEYTAMKTLDAWLYLILIPVCIVINLISMGIIYISIKFKLRHPSLTASQKQNIKTALKEDEEAKIKNVEACTLAKQKWNDDRKIRLPEIDIEIQKCVNDFENSKKDLDSHMEKLANMNALCDDDKQLQIVELLIRFIKTRRADSVKEALQEYDKLMVNQQLLELEKQKLTAELQRVAQENAAQQRQLEEQLRYQEEMKYLARDTAQSRANAARELNNIGAILYHDLHA